MNFYIYTIAKSTKNHKNVLCISMKTLHPSVLQKNQVKKYQSNYLCVDIPFTFNLLDFVLFCIPFHPCKMLCQWHMVYLTSTYDCSSCIDCTYVQFWNVKMNFKLTNCNENHKCDCDGKLHDLYKCFTHICSCEILQGKKMNNWSEILNKNIQDNNGGKKRADIRWKQMKDGGSEEFLDCGKWCESDMLVWLFILGKMAFGFAIFGITNCIVRTP